MLVQPLSVNPVPAGNLRTWAGVSVSLRGVNYGALNQIYCIVLCAKWINFKHWTTVQGFHDEEPARETSWVNRSANLHPLVSYKTTITISVVMVYIFNINHNIIAFDIAILKVTFNVIESPLFCPLLTDLFLHLYTAQCQTPLYLAIIKLCMFYNVHETTNSPSNSQVKVCQLGIHQCSCGVNTILTVILLCFPVFFCLRVTALLLLVLLLIH